MAIVAVMLSHSKELFSSFGITDPRILHSLSYGRLGVDLFFAISGFLICRNLLSEYHNAGRISLLSFYTRRAFRILPLYYVYLATLWLLSVWGGLSVTGQELTASALFLRNYVSIDSGAYTNHLWSLAVEEHFYLLFPMLLVVLRSRLAIWVVPGLALAIHIWRALDARYQISASVLPDAGLLFRSDTRMDALLWGCFAALFTHRFPDWRASPWLSLVAILGLVATVVWGAPMLFLVLALLFAAIVVSTVASPESPISQCLEWKPLRWIGRLSYSLYIWQTIWLQHAAPPDPDWFNRVKVWPVNLIGIVVCAVGSYFLIERPMIRWGRRLTRS